MKKFLNIVAAFALLALAFTASAQQDQTKVVFAGQGTAESTTNAFFVVSSQGSGAPVVRFYDVTGDSSPSVLYFRTCSLPRVITAASSGTSLTTLGTGYSSGDIIVIHQKATDTYLRRILSGEPSSTNIPVTVAATVSVGDVVWKTSVAGSIPTGNGNKQLAASGGIFAGTAGRPLLIDHTGTNTPTINAISGDYVK